MRCPRCGRQWKATKDRTCSVCEVFCKESVALEPLTRTVHPPVSETIVEIPQHGIFGWSDGTKRAGRL